MAVFYDIIFLTFLMNDNRDPFYIFNGYLLFFFHKIKLDFTTNHIIG